MLPHIATVRAQVKTEMCVKKKRLTAAAAAAAANSPMGSWQASSPFSTKAAETQTVQLKQSFTVGHRDQSHPLYNPIKLFDLPDPCPALQRHSGGLLLLKFVHLILHTAVRNIHTEQHPAMHATYQEALAWWFMGWPWLWHPGWWLERQTHRISSTNARALSIQQ